MHHCASVFGERVSGVNKCLRSDMATCHMTNVDTVSSFMFLENHGVGTTGQAAGERQESL